MFRRSCQVPCTLIARGTRPSGEGNVAYVPRRICPACNSCQLLRHLLAFHPTSTLASHQFTPNFSASLSWLPWGFQPHTLDSLPPAASPPRLFFFSSLATLPPRLFTTCGLFESALSFAGKGSRAHCVALANPFYCHVSQRPLDVASVLVAHSFAPIAFHPVINSILRLAICLLHLARRLH